MKPLYMTSALTLGVQVPTGWYGSSAWMIAASVPTSDHMLAQPSDTVPDQAQEPVVWVRPELEPSEISLPTVLRRTPASAALVACSVRCPRARAHHMSSSGYVMSVVTVVLNVARNAVIAVAFV